MPTFESQNYYGLMIDQIAALMAERQINFSILSPRKLNYLYKLFQSSGGDLQAALSKKYAKDSRHLVLLRGFQLQERPSSPQTTSNSQASEQKQNQQSLSQQAQSQNQSQIQLPTPPQQSQQSSPSQSSNVTQGQKRPLSPSLPPSSSGALTSSIAVTSSVNTMSMQSQGPRPNAPNTTGIPSPFAQPVKSVTPDTIVRPTKNASPAPLNAPWTPGAPSTPGTPNPVSSSSPAPTNMPVLTSQLQLKSIPRPVQQQTNQSNVQGLSHSQASQQPSGFKPQMSGPSVRAMGNQQIRNQLGQPVQSPFSAPPVPSPLASQQSPLPVQKTTPSPLQQSVASPMQPQQLQQMQLNQAQLQNSSLQQQPPQFTQQMQMQPTTSAGMTASQPSNAPGPPVEIKDRRRIWCGIIEYQEKPNQPGPATPANRITYSLNCFISCPVVNGEPEINTEKWPEKLVLQLLPKQLIMRLFPILKTASHHVGLHFSNDNEGLGKLSKIMSTNWVSVL